MTSVVTELRISRIQAHRYRMPLKRAYGTARGVTKASTNIVVAISAEHGGQRFTGYGECQPRHVLTGDGDRRGNSAWSFLVPALQRLHRRSIPAKDRHVALAAIRGLMAELDVLAAEHADDTNRDRPFRGTMLGIEVALLDVVARSLNLQIAELLGKRRDEIGVSISTISSSTSLDDVAGKVIKQSRFPMTRVKGIGDLEHDWSLLETVTDANRSAKRDKPIWMDINEALDVSQAMAFIDGMVDRMAAGRLPASLVLEGILPKSQVTDLPLLQRHADAASREASGEQPLDLRIMPDEGMWDVTDLERVNAAGGCRALNIKAPKAGGLLASLDLAEAAVAADPDIHVCIGGMVGTSDATAWALHNLARALPRIDYLTAVPPTNVEQRITEPKARYVARDSNIIAAQVRPGLGTDLVLENVKPYVEASFDTAGTNAETSATSTITPRRASSEYSMISQQAESADDDASLTLVLAGDTSLGDVHINAKGGALLDRLNGDPFSFFELLQPLISDTDAFILNLETVLADSPISPFEGKKRFLGWDSPDRAVRVLKGLGVNAVGLANNHTMDFGADNLARTIGHLKDGGIDAFGAGASLAEAAEPLTFAFTLGGTERRVHLIAACEVQRKLRDEYQFYAGESRPGVNPMSVDDVAGAVHELRSSDPSSLIIVYPHWGGNYHWVKESAQRANQRFVQAGANLVVGHGAHMLQQLTFAKHHASIYSLGNFVFNWSGRFEQYDVPPYGLVARVNLAWKNGTWDVGLRLYPIASDNKKTGFRVQPLSEGEFTSMWDALLAMDLDGSFAEQARPARDARGFHIAFDYSAALGHAPGAAVTETGASGTATDASRSDVASMVEMLPNDIDVFSRGSTTALLAHAVAAKDLPFQIMRVPGPASSPDTTRTVMRFTVKDRTYFVRSGTVATTRADGLPGTGIDGRAVRICKRKDVTAAILRRHGFSVPRGMAFASRDIAGAKLYFDAVIHDSPQGLCVKPANGNKGKNIYLNIQRRNELTAAFAAIAANGYETVLVEECVTGEVLRFLYIGSKVVAARRGVPAHVVGDGTSSVRELVAAKNADLRRRGADRHSRLRLGPDELEFLQRHGLSDQTAPAHGDRVFLSSLSNRHAAAEIVDCTDDVHPSYLTVVEKATSLIPDIAVCGVDLMIADISVPAADGNHHFIELNTTPGLRGHHQPSVGVSRDVAGMIIEHVIHNLP
ncbi:hypothetical protein G1H11_17795 [Phytoactinopolyspora alkaliphila]|uniref:ATP-grasp domain-containing protein n=1 Tax=Phytoactinopolyspora alkaliphila TaxID=1783498 RepID=A0A6N9YQD5_9ACTN|nr:CapA family protein [Phytoactinopolyspora alkaliphila]NED97155.1 hypothetical protein [Phytoactinopolyspora alkaliphila]